MPASFLRRRNALWLALRTAEPGSGPFEEALRELSELTGWNRARVLAGLGLIEDDSQTPAGPSEQEPT